MVMKIDLFLHSKLFLRMTEVVFAFDIKQDLLPEYKEWVLANSSAIAQNAIPGFKYIGTWITKVGTSNQVERRFSVESFESIKLLVEGKRTESQQKLISEERKYVSGAMSTKIITRIC